MLQPCGCEITCSEMAMYYSNKLIIKCRTYTAMEEGICKPEPALLWKQHFPLPAISESWVFSFLKNEELILPKFTKPGPVILNSNKGQFHLAALQQGNFLEIHELSGCQAKQSWELLGVSGIPSWTPSSMCQGWGLEERRPKEPGRVSRAEKSPGQFWSPAKTPSQTLASALST